MKTFEEAEKFFYQDHFAHDATDITIVEFSEYYAKCKFDIKEKHLNVNGTVMGGAIFTLADFTYAVASDSAAVSSSSSITYLNTSKGKTLFAEAKMIKDGRTTVFYEIKVYDDLGKDIAFVTMNGIKIPPKA